MKARKNRAFFVETLIVTFLLLLMLVILVRIFGEAARRSQLASWRTKATQIAQNVVTMFEASEGEIGKTQQELIDIANDEYSDVETPQTTLTLHFNDSGELAEDGEFEVTLLTTCEMRAVGYMLTGNLSIVNTKDTGIELASLDTARYFPDDVDAVLSGDTVFSFDDIFVVDTEAETDSETGADTEAEADSETQADAQSGSAAADQAETEVAS